MADRHHCSCFSINPAYSDLFRAMLDYYGFKDRPQLPKGQLYGRVMRLDGDDQIHIRLMPSGIIEAEIEPSQSYMEHLNPRYSYPAHDELEELLDRCGIEHDIIDDVPDSCTEPPPERPPSLTPVRNVIIGAIALVAIGALTRKLARR